MFDAAQLAAFSQTFALHNTKSRITPHAKYPQESYTDINGAFALNDRFVRERGQFVVGLPV